MCPILVKIPGAANGCSQATLHGFVRDVNGADRSPSDHEGGDESSRNSLGRVARRRPKGGRGGAAGGRARCGTVAERADGAGSAGSRGVRGASWACGQPRGRHGRHGELRSHASQHVAGCDRRANAKACAREAKQFGDRTLALSTSVQAGVGAGFGDKGAAAQSRGPPVQSRSASLFHFLPGGRTPGCMPLRSAMWRVAIATLVRQLCRICRHPRAQSVVLVGASPLSHFLLPLSRHGV